MAGAVKTSKKSQPFADRFAKELEKIMSEMNNFRPELSSDDPTDEKFVARLSSLCDDEPLTELENARDQLLSSSKKLLDVSKEADELCRNAKTRHVLGAEWNTDHHNAGHTLDLGYAHTYKLLTLNLPHAADRGFGALTMTSPAEQMTRDQAKISLKEDPALTKKALEALGFDLNAEAEGDGQPKGRSGGHDFGSAGSLLNSAQRAAKRLAERVEISDDEAARFLKLQQELHQTEQLGEDREIVDAP